MGERKGPPDANYLGKREVHCGVGDSDNRHLSISPRKRSASGRKGDCREREPDKSEGRERKFVVVLGKLIACSEDFRSGWLRSRNTRRASHQQEFRYLVNIKDSESELGKVIISLFDAGKSKVLARIVTTHGGFERDQCGLINLSRFSAIKLFPRQLKVLEAFGDVSNAENNYLSEFLYFKSFDLKSRLCVTSPQALVVKSGAQLYTTHSWTLTISQDGEQLLVGGLMHQRHHPKPNKFLRVLSLAELFADSPRLVPLLAAESAKESVPPLAADFAVLPLDSETAEEVREAAVDPHSPTAKLYLCRHKTNAVVLAIPSPPSSVPRVLLGDLPLTK